MLVSIQVVCGAQVYDNSQDFFFADLVCPPLYNNVSFTKINILTPDLVFPASLIPSSELKISDLGMRLVPSTARKHLVHSLETALNT